jgi:hypothetical protein
MRIMSPKAQANESLDEHKEGHPGVKGVCDGCYYDDISANAEKVWKNFFEKVE